MSHSRTIVIATVLLMHILGLQQPAEAGKILYQQCFTALGDTADGFKAALAKDGLFFAWGGYSVIEPVKEGEPCPPTGMKGAPPDLFRAENAKGTNAITAALKKNVPINVHMLFSSIRNNTALDPDPMKTTFTLKSNDIRTKFGKAATRARGDPIIDITNGGSSVMTLLSIVAQIHNSQDPLDLDSFFVPDGVPVAVTPSLLPINLLPGDTAEFMFSLDDSPNWSFQYTYASEGDTFVDLLASDVAVPVPNSFGLFIAGIVVIMILRRHASWIGGQGRARPATRAPRASASA